MFELLVKNSVRKVVIESDIVLFAIDPLVVNFLSSLNTMESVVNLKSFDFKPVLPIPIPPIPITDFSYKILLLDGRVFNSTINWLLTLPFDPAFTFDVPSLWKDSELSTHRLFRDSVISLKQNKLVTKINVDYF